MKKLLLVLIFPLLLFCLVSCYDENAAKQKIQAAFADDILKYQNNDNRDSVRESLILKKAYDEVTIVWSSNNEAVITDKGIVKRPTDNDTLVFFTATATYKKTTLQKIYELTVKADFTDVNSVTINIEGMFHYEQSFNYTGVIKINGHNLDIIINLYLGTIQIGIIYYFEREDYYSTGQVITAYPSLPSQLEKHEITDDYQRIATTLLSLIKLKNLDGVTNQKTLMQILNQLGQYLTINTVILNDILTSEASLSKTDLHFLIASGIIPDIDFSNFSTFDLDIVFSVDIDLLLMTANLNILLIDESQTTYRLSLKADFTDYNHTTTQYI